MRTVSTMTITPYRYSSWYNTGTGIGGDLHLLEDIVDQRCLFLCAKKPRPTKTEAHVISPFGLTTFATLELLIQQ